MMPLLAEMNLHSGLKHQRTDGCFIPSSFKGEACHLTLKYIYFYLFYSSWMCNFCKSRLTSLWNFLKHCFVWVSWYSNFWVCGRTACNKLSSWEHSEIVHCKKNTVGFTGCYWQTKSCKDDVNWCKMDYSIILQSKLQLIAVCEIQ